MLQSSVVEVKRCDRCQVAEGTRHPVGDFVVKLTDFHSGNEIKSLCSHCLIRAEVKRHNTDVAMRRKRRKLFGFMHMLKRLK